MNTKNTNNTRGGFIVEYKLLIIFILALILCYFGLFAESTRFILSWEIGFIDSASPFMESLIDLYFMVWYILIIVLVGVLYILTRILYLFTWNASVLNYILNSSLLSRFFNFSFTFFFIIYNFIDKVLFINFVRNFILKVSNSNILNMWYGKKRAEFLTIQNLSEYKRLELLWCALPSIALISIGNPTFGLIFALDPAIDPEITLKVIGHQWYWSYEYDVTMKVAFGSPEYKFTDRARFHAKWIEEHYPNGRYYYKGKTLTEMLDLEFDGTDWQRPSGEEMHQFILDKNKYKPVVHYSLAFDSTLIDTDDLPFGFIRLLETTNPVVLPYSVPIKVLVTSADVLHSWAVPSLGIKVDAVPGRINQFIFEIKGPGYFYGQCSELCGGMHGYMPINIQAVSMDEFRNWLKANAEII